MTCDEARERFEDLLHDRLSPAESQSLRQHLSECPQCLEELDAAGVIQAWEHARRLDPAATRVLEEEAMKSERELASVTERIVRGPWLPTSERAAK